MKNACLLMTAMFIGMISYAQQITNVTPNSGTVGQNLTIVVTGQSTSFVQATSTNQMTLVHSQQSNTINAWSINPSSNTNATANFAVPTNAPVGMWNLIVNNSIDGLMTFNNAVNMNPGPSLQTINPDSAIFGQTINVVLTTANTAFSQGTQVSVFLSQGTSTILNANSASYNSPTSINAQFTIPAPYTVGYYNVHLNNLILPNSFYINGGNSSLGGMIVQGTKAGVGDPIKDLDLYLMSPKDDTLLTTTTDANGEFIFEHLAYGNYKLFGDKLDNSNALEFELNTSNPDVEGLIIILEDGRLISGLNKVDNSKNVKVFPNPFSDQLNIDLGSYSTEYSEIQIFDITGKLVKTIAISNKAKQNSVISISTELMMKNSVYYLKLLSRDGSSKSFKVLKSE